MNMIVETNEKVIREHLRRFAGLVQTAGVMLDERHINGSAQLLLAKLAVRDDPRELNNELYAWAHQAQQDEVA